MHSSNGRLLPLRDVGSHIVPVGAAVRCCVHLPLRRLRLWLWLLWRSLFHKGNRVLDPSIDSLIVSLRDFVINKINNAKVVLLMLREPKRSIDPFVIYIDTSESIDRRNNRLRTWTGKLAEQKLNLCRRYTQCSAFY